MRKAVKKNASGQSQTTSAWQLCKRCLMDVSLLLPPLVFWMVILLPFLGSPWSAAASASLWLLGFLPDWLGVCAYMLFFSPMAWVTQQKYFIYKTNHMARCNGSTSDVIPADMRMPNTYLAMLLPACYAHCKQLVNTTALAEFVNMLVKVQDKKVLHKVMADMVNTYGHDGFALKMNAVAKLQVENANEPVASVSKCIMEILQRQHMPLAVLQQRLLDEGKITNNPQSFMLYLKGLEILKDSVAGKTYRQVLQGSLPTSAKHWFDTNTNIASKLRTWIARIDLNQQEHLQRLVCLTENACRYELDLQALDDKFLAIMETDYFDDFITSITEGSMPITDAIETKSLRRSVLSNRLMLLDRPISDSWQGASEAELDSLSLFVHDIRALKYFQQKKTEWYALSEVGKVKVFFECLLGADQVTSSNIDDFCSEFVNKGWQVHLSQAICQQIVQVMRSDGSLANVKKAFGYFDLSGVGRTVVECFKAGKLGWQLCRIALLDQRVKDLRNKRINCFPSVAPEQTLYNYLHNETSWDRLIFDNDAHGQVVDVGGNIRAEHKRDQECMYLFVRLKSQFRDFNYDDGRDRQNILARLRAGMMYKVQHFCIENKINDHDALLRAANLNSAFSTVLQELVRVLIALSIVENELRQNITKEELKTKVCQWKNTLVNLFCTFGREFNSEEPPESHDDFAQLITIDYQLGKDKRNNGRRQGRYNETVTVTCRADNTLLMQECYEFSAFVDQYRHLDGINGDAIGFCQMYALFFFLIDLDYKSKMEEVTLEESRQRMRDLLDSVQAGKVIMSAKQTVVAYSSSDGGASLELVRASEAISDTLSAIYDPARELEKSPRCKASRNEILMLMETILPVHFPSSQSINAATAAEQLPQNVCNLAIEKILGPASPLYSAKPPQVLLTKLSEFLLKVIKNPRNTVMNQFSFYEFFQLIIPLSDNYSGCVNGTIRTIMKTELAKVKEMLSNSLQRDEYDTFVNKYEKYYADESHYEEVLDGYHPEWLLAHLRTWLTKQLAKSFQPWNEHSLDGFLRGNYEEVYTGLGLKLKQQGGDFENNQQRNQALLAIYIVYHEANDTFGKVSSVEVGKKLFERFIGDLKRHYQSEVTAAFSEYLPENIPPDANAFMQTHYEQVYKVLMLDGGLTYKQKNANILACFQTPHDQDPSNQSAFANMLKQINAKRASFEPSSLKPSFQA